MDDQPQQPCGQSSELSLSYLSHSTLSADGGHGAEVFIYERLHLLSGLFPHDIPCHIVSLLQGYLCQLGMS